MSELNKPQPPSKYDDVIRDHEYDGIQEYDNPTPGWWTWLFVLSIIFSALYWFTDVSTGGALSAVTAYEHAVLEETKRQFGQLGELKPDEPTILQLMGEEKWVRVGAATYAVNCASCHGNSGEGTTGPNLTDDRYINVKKLADIPDVIRNGRANGAMPAWQNRLSDNEIIVVSAFVASLRGKALPDGRTYMNPGTPIDPWPTPQK